MKDRPWLAILAFALVTFAGNGAYWKWQELKLAVSARASDLLRQENDSYQKIIDLSDRLNTAETDLENHAAGSSPLEILTLKSRLDFEKGVFGTVERQLAQIEQRPERKINLNFVRPSAPGKITATPLLPKKTD